MPEQVTNLHLDQRIARVRIACLLHRLERLGGTLEGLQGE